MKRIRGRKSGSNGPKRGIHEDVNPKEPDLTVEEMRTILSSRKKALGRPANILFLCLGGNDCSPLMKTEFEKTIQAAGLSDFFDVKSGGWNRMGTDGLAWADVALPLIVDVKGDKTAFPYALRNLTERMSRPDIPEFIDFEVNVPVYNDEHLMRAVKGADYGSVLQKTVTALRTMPEDVTLKEPDLTLDEMTSILEDRTNGGKNPVKVMFLWTSISQQTSVGC
jgi:hypothetical protein